ncbi:proteasome assembly chaperone family protein [Candidatus Woesearchaeota archaeon]|nr:proteasome assembly chaperone family protein [Candidatus Woesearchaeota archaeon]
MRIELTEKPQGVILIEGFPGYGLIGTITTEFLISHLNAKQIGRIQSDKINPVVMVHDGKVIDPIGIFYAKKNKIVILHALISVTGMEWELAEIINDLSKQLKVKEIISIEGVGSVKEEVTGKEVIVNTYYYSQSKEKWKKTGSNPLDEGVVMGVTGALLLKKGLPLSCVFAEAQSKLPVPDSRASAKVIEILDKYLGLNVDYKPLLKKADEFEGKLKTLLEGSKKALDSKKEKESNYELDYLG